MSLGDSNGFKGNGNNGGDNKYYPNVYSGLSFYNDESALNFRFYLTGILEMKIVPKNNNGKGFNNEAALSIYLSMNRAIALHEALNMLREDIKNGKTNNYGVCNNKKTGNIEFGVTKINGSNHLYCTIYKYGSNGNISDSYTFQFVDNDEFIIKNFSPNDLSFDREVINDMPLVQIQYLLKEYAKGVTGGGAYGVEYLVGQYKYNVSSLKKMLGGGDTKQIASSNNSIFNNNGSSNKPTNDNNFEENDFDDLDW